MTAPVTPALSAPDVLPMTFTVPSEHPALPGHFPGEPVVPGVVILDHVLARLPLAAGEARTLAWVKFLRPLLAGQEANVAFEWERAQLRFTVIQGGECLVRGALVALPIANALAASLPP